MCKFVLDWRRSTAARVCFSTVGDPQAATKAATRRLERATGGPQQKLRANGGVLEASEGRGPKFRVFFVPTQNYSLCALSGGAMAPLSSAKVVEEHRFLCGVV